jgi:hypothetical protein
MFLGDMDPYAIVQYEETRRLLMRRVGVTLIYGGIDDAWLGAIDRALVPPRSLERVTIPLDTDEIKLMRKLDRALDLAELLGPRGSAMLRAGRKLELEGATNTHLYGPGHGRWIFEHLRSLAGRAART